MTALTVSVVTPSYNQGRYIERTICSVLNQAIPELEYIVNDGGSTDNTIAILKKYEQQIRWRSEKDNGQAHAVNKGFNLASGDIIGWLNSDDIYYPDAINKVLQYFRDHPYVDVLYGQACQIDSNDRMLELYPTEPWNLKRFKAHCFISQPATFIRRHAILQYGLLDETLNFCMDYEYWLRLALRGANFAYLPEVLAGTRIYADTKSSRYVYEAHLEAINMLQKKLGYIPSEWMVNYATAKVKTKAGFYFPDPRFIVTAWANLWTAAGLHHAGFTRVKVWLKAQAMMVRKLLRKGLTKSTSRSDPL